jgi:preprotein translocase subunit YajC
MGLLLVYFALLAVGFFVAVVRPQRRRVAAHRDFVAALAVGDEVITTGGVFGTIRSVRDDRVGLEVAPGTVLTVARAAIAQAAPGED